MEEASGSGAALCRLLRAKKALLEEEEEELVAGLVAGPCEGGRRKRERERGNTVVVGKSQWIARPKGTLTLQVAGPSRTPSVCSASSLMSTRSTLSAPLSPASVSSTQSPNRKVSFALPPIRSPIVLRKQPGNAKLETLIESIRHSIPCSTTVFEEREE
eukprot:TRINITY_DN259_c0_g1_i1.p1 TRINITY_DN259_c0_g1~~TRINITY_DN259_c0_g1_i1.p1  ORF type:complete len:171 (+),score=17.18 TRINITY_DN259_c0_g1_i1:38-514(+)